MKIKTSELEGAALDWAVGRATSHGVLIGNSGRLYIVRGYTPIEWSPSTNWAQGGPIIERAGIGLDYYPDGGHPQGGEWGALTNEGMVESFGPTPLIAAMRCYVASKLGGEVDIPDELTR